MESRNEKRMLTAACHYAYSRFVLDHYMFCETVMEGASSFDTLEIPRTLVALTGRFLRGEYPVDELDQFREQLIKETDVIAAYMDRFQIYGYVLDRMEGRFLDTAALELVDDEAFTDEIMGFILSPKDTAVTNSRIKMILEQLPIRFTKAKFFSIVSQALSVYEGTDKKSLVQVLAMLRTEAMLDDVQDQGGHEDLQALLAKLRGADHKALTREDYQELFDALSVERESLANVSYSLLFLMDLINDLYVVCLTRGETLMDRQEEDLFKTILAKMQEKVEHVLFAGPEGPQRDLETTEAGDIEALLVQMEGKQEHYQEQWSRYERTDPGKDTDRDGDKEDERSLRMRKVERLLSTSSFMSLEEEEEPEGEGVLLSRKAVEELCQPFLEELGDSWKIMPKVVVRAVMARLLSVLPMFFTSVEEIRQFILGCLTSCSDMVEKAACADLIRQIMESGDAVV